jgi:hypothetical protein
MIELSIVILVISAIVVGVSSTQLMIKKARLANAQSLTQDSIVKTLSNDLVAWYETSMESSFIKSEIKKDAGSISKWKDNNINAVKKNDATMTNTANQPKLYQNAFYDSIPGLRFDGNDDYLNFDLGKIVNSAYTIFVVDQRRSNKNENYFFSGGTSTINNRIHLGYRNDTNVTLAHYLNDANFSFPSYTTPKSYIHSFVFNGNIGKRYSMNGNIKGTTSQLAPLGSTINATIAKYSNIYYNGDLAEIIIFKRSLKTEEIKAIENYLGSKYGISVS